MPAHATHRDAIVRTAAVLFRRQGYAATGTNQIVTASGAPKGSLYHYFPHGKEQIAQAAVEQAGAVVQATLARLVEEQPSPGAALREYGRMLARWLADSGYRDGCPITTVLLELTPASDGITRAGRDAFDSWTQLLADALHGAGAPPTEAARLASVAVAALEGALMLARVHQDATPVLDAAQAMADLFDAAAA